MAKKRFVKRNHRRYRKQGRPNKAKRYAIVKEMGYNGFHCFKEKVFKTYTITTDLDGAGMLSTSDPPTDGWSESSQTYQLSDLTDHLSYQGLFDEFRITGVSIKVFPLWDAASSIVQTAGETTGEIYNTVSPPAVVNTTATDIDSQTNSFQVPYIFWRIDKNDVTNPASVSAMMEKDPKFMRWNGTKKIYVQNPTVLALASNDPTEAVDVNNMIRRPVKSPWLSLQTGRSAKHMGLELGIMNAQPSSRHPINCVLTYYFQCKGNV